MAGREVVPAAAMAPVFSICCSFSTSAVRSRLSCHQLSRRTRQVRQSLALEEKSVVQEIIAELEARHGHAKIGRSPEQLKHRAPAFAVIDLNRK